MGAPENIRIVELGPGRGTMMKDALRAAKVVPDFREAAVIHLVEISPALEAQQERTLEQLPMPVYWHRDARRRAARARPSSSPTNSSTRCRSTRRSRSRSGWHERRVDVDAAGNLAFTVAPDPLPQFDSLLPAAAA